MSNTPPLQPDDELRITVQFPGLPVRPIGPGDDIVISSQKLADYIAAEVQEAYKRGYIDGGIAQLTKPSEDFNMEEIAMCKGCKTMKHLNAEGYCGRCVKGEDTVRG